MNLDLNVESIILLLFFIAPGFFFTRTYTAYRPRYYRAPDAFEQVVLAIVGSAIIHGTILAGLALGLLLYWFIDGHWYYVSMLLRSPMPLASYPLPALALFIFAAISYLAVSLVLARRFATFLGFQTFGNRPHWWKFLLGNDPPEPFLLWHTILQVEPLQFNLIPPRLNIQMRSGEYFEGDLYSMRLVGDEENTVELALRNASYRPAATVSKTRSHSSSTDLQPLPNQVILLKSSDILWLTRNDLPR